jgi:hypothetical protein
MAEIAAAYATVSDKIRALNAAGVPRAEIARFLGKRYQHVRNVLEGDAVAGPTYTLGRADLSGVREADRSFEMDRTMDEWRTSGIFKLVVREDGSLILPSAVREALKVATGGVVMGRLIGEEFTLITAEASMRRAQEMARALIEPGVSLSEELIADRRREAQREESGD